MTSEDANGDAAYTSALPRHASERPRYAADFLGEAFAVVIGARKRSHGDPLETHRRIAEVWNGMLMAAGKLSAPLDAHDAATLMEGLKIARRYGGVFNADDYVDAAGYAALAAEIQLRLHPEKGEER